MKRPVYRCMFVTLFVLSASAAAAAQSGREKVFEALDKGGCARVEPGGVEVCGYDYASEGRNVEAVSFRPAGAGRFPALLLIPGHQRSARDYLGLGAAFASAGFACLAVSQPGFGRSEGGADFAGPRTLAALRAGLERFKREPYVDAGRLGVYGYSRGAMAASLLVVGSRDVRAAVFGGGVYDFKKAYDEVTNEGIRRNMEREAGLTPEAVKARSSVLHMEALRCPVLILHGEKDESAPLSQALLLRDRLTALKKDFEIKIVPDKGHALGMDEVLGSSLDFFKRRLAPGAPKGERAPRGRPRPRPGGARSSSSWTTTTSRRPYLKMAEGAL